MSKIIVDWAGYFLAMVPIAVVWFWYAGHYTRRKPYWEELKNVFQVLSVLFIVEGTVLYLSKADFSRLWMASSFLLLAGVLPAFRFAVKKILIKSGLWQIPTVVIGTGLNAIDAITALKSEPLLGFSVQNVLALEPVATPAMRQLRVDGTAIPIDPLGADPVGTIRRFGEPNILFALESGGIRDHLDLLEQLHRNFNDIYVVPALRGLPLYGMEISFFFRHEVLLLRLRNNLARRMPRLFKRCFDIAGAIALLALLSPLLLVLAMLIRRDGGPALFGHKRVGHGGRPFQCLKFRSMQVNAEKLLQTLLAEDPEACKEWAADFKLKDDPRITGIGHFLRRTSLDELPQLWNVLRGEMSLVGPRPVVEDELQRYGNDVHYYTLARPGMTGLWQVSGRNDTDYLNRVYLDTWYVKNWSLWMDIAILFKTIRVVTARQGAY